MRSTDKSYFYIYILGQQINCIVTLIYYHEPICSIVGPVMSIKCKKPLSWITYVGNLIGVSTLKHGEEEPHHAFLSPGSLILRFNQAKKKQKKSQGPTLSIMGNFHFLQIS